MGGGDTPLSPANAARLHHHTAGLPARYTWQDIALAAAPLSAETPKHQDRLDAALATLARLAHPDRVDSQDSQPPEHLAESLVAALLPLIPATDGAARAPLIAETVLACLRLLSNSWSCSLDGTALVSIVHYTDPDDAWTTNEAASIASGLLAHHLPRPDLRADLIAGPLLQGYLRPIFSRSSARVTATGRPSHFRDQAENPSGQMEPPPWKQAGLQVVTDFQWAVRVSDAASLSQHWPLFTPVLLALAEDPATAVRAKGLEILAVFVEKCPGQVLQSTGIAAVFQDAVFPTLLYLPSLTPEGESLELLEPAYRALLAVAELDQDQGNARRRRLLDKLLREGILAGYHHASQHIRIVELLMHQTATIVGTLGIFATKHLPALLPLFASVMADPFALAHPPAVLATAKALNSTLANCWPRVSDAHLAGQVMRVAILCWLNVHDGEAAPQAAAGGLDAINRELAQTATFLESLWAQSKLEPPGQWAEALRRRPQLAELFPGLGERLAAPAS